MRSLYLGFLAGSLGLSSFAQAALNQDQVQQILADIQADAKNQLKTVNGRTWTLADDDVSQQLDLQIQPAGAFTWARSGTGNIFQVRLVNVALLRDQIGEIAEIKFTTVGKGTPPSPSESKDVAVSFSTTFGDPVVYDNLARNPNVANLSIAVNPPIASVKRKEGNTIYFTRDIAKGLVPVEVTLQFSLNGKKYVYKASLPTKDDGYRYTFTERKRYCDVRVHIGREYKATGATKKQALDNLLFDLNHALRKSCERYVDYQSKNYPDSQRNVIMDFVPVNDSHFENDRPFCRKPYGEAEFTCKATTYTGGYGLLFLRQDVREEVACCMEFDWWTPVFKGIGSSY